MSRTIGLSLGMHNETKEAIRAIESFKRFYPDGEIKLWGNQPNELAQVSLYFNMSGEDSPNYMNKLFAIIKAQQKPKGDEAAEVIREFLNSCRKIYESMKSEYVIYMHPDHLMIRRLNTNKLKFDLEMFKVNKYTPQQKVAWKAVSGKELTLDSYGLAGYYRREPLVQVLNFLTNESEFSLNKLLELNNDFIFEDLIIPCGFDLLGYRIGDQSLTRELRRRRRISQYFVKPTLLHQMPRVN